MKRGATYKPKKVVDIINLDNDSERFTGYKFNGKLYNINNQALPANYVQVKNWTWVLLVCGAASMWLICKIIWG